MMSAAIPIVALSQELWKLKMGKMKKQKPKKKIDWVGVPVAIIQPRLETNQGLCKQSLNNLVRLIYGSRVDSHIRRTRVLIENFKKSL